MHPVHTLHGAGARKEAFGKLVCGELSDGSEAAQVLEHLKNSLHAFSDKAVSLLASEQNDDLVLFGPFSARVIMECSTALVKDTLTTPQPSPAC